ncbi:MAG: CAP domain-containing protein [Desulforhopalus sp.]|nr:CAP domain-containing protein [Desulforhopalus sp.]
MKTLFLLVLALLALLSCTAQGASVLNTEATTYSQELFEQINQYRRDKGLPALRFDPLLSSLAKVHSTDMAQQETMNHNNFDDRFERAGSRLCVENVGWNFRSAREMYEAWRRSSNHNRNMLHREITRAGIAEVDMYVTFLACK